MTKNVTFASFKRESFDSFFFFILRTNEGTINDLLREKCGREKLGEYFSTFNIHPKNFLHTKKKKSIQKY